MTTIYLLYNAGKSMEGCLLAQAIVLPLLESLDINKKPELLE